MRKSHHVKQKHPAPIPGWKLGEAKAKFSELVRRATAGQPQRVTVHGKDAVVIVGRGRIRCPPGTTAPSGLHALLSQSPLSRLPFGEDGVRSPVREVEL